MERQIIAYKNYYKDFFNSLTEKVQEKVLYAMLMLNNEINKAIELKNEYYERKKEQ